MPRPECWQKSARDSKENPMKHKANVANVIKVNRESESGALLFPLPSPLFAFSLPPSLPLSLSRSLSLSLSLSFLLSFLSLFLFLFSFLSSSAEISVDAAASRTPGISGFVDPLKGQRRRIVADTFDDRGGAGRCTAVTRVAARSYYPIVLSNTRSPSPRALPSPPPPSPSRGHASLRACKV